MWQFTTEVPPPGSFSKSSPKNGVSNQPVDLDLTWQTSGGATYYEYCLMNTTPLPEPSPYDGCDSPWVRADSSPASLLDLDYSTTYYWQVRAVNSTGLTESNSGAWWSFTTQAYTTMLYLPLVLR